MLNVLLKKMTVTLPSFFRSLFIGSCAGAKYGLDGIPVEWINKTKSAEDVLSAAIDIVKKK